MTPRAHTSPSGYVLVTILLLGSLICLTAGTFARHALVSYRTSSASLWVQQTREAAASALAFAEQLSACGYAEYEGAVATGEDDVALTLVETGAGRRTVRIDATKGGLGTTLLAEASVLGTVGRGLPHPTSAAAVAALGDPGKLEISGAQTLQDTVIEGTLVLTRGSRLTLRDVVVKGTIVSEPALAGPPYAPLEATSLLLEGNVRVDGGLVMPGCAIVLPDGQCTVASGSRVELHGAVVAGRVQWQGGGVLDGPLASDQDVSLPGGVDRPGWGRTPADWPESLTATGWIFATLSFPRADASGLEALTIQGYAFTGI